MRAGDALDAQVVEGEPRAAEQRRGEVDEELVDEPVGDECGGQRRAALDVDVADLGVVEAVEDRGGAVAAIEEGFQKTEIERAAYQVALQIDSGDRVVVGLNRFTVDDDEPYEPLRVDPAIEAEQAARLATLRAERDQAAVDHALVALQHAARGTDNVLYPMREALAARATVGEVCHALREVWGTYVPRDAF